MTQPKMEELAKLNGYGIVFWANGIWNIGSMGLTQESAKRILDDINIDGPSSNWRMVEVDIKFVEE